MLVAVVREGGATERRVALVPALVPRLTDAGCEVAVEPDAGAAAGFADDAYERAGAVVTSTALRDADVLLSVRPPTIEQVGLLAMRAVVVGLLAPAAHPELVAALCRRSCTAFAMELVPRIARAQSMDALSSQALVAGYRAAVLAAERLPRFLPLLMTAAGTVRPARVLVLGAGVAGLQAIATSRRLGAVVSAYDVRAAAAEEVRSVGGEFVTLDLDSLDGTGGYAREMGEDRSRRQRELLAPHVAAADILITTAAVPGRPAPLLVTTDMVAAMPAGAVVVDLAAEQGGNVQGSRPGEELTVGGALVIGGMDLPSRLPAQASELYAANVVNLLSLVLADGALRVDLDDEVLAGCCVTHDGAQREVR
jgi:H+-translocating NAD(P) transhydrogenase subunit alpha